MATINDVFVKTVITKDLWPVQSPNLTLCYFYLWGSLKDEVYRRNAPHELEENTKEELSSISTAKQQW
jgi:hypothetical protein